MKKNLLARVRIIALVIVMVCTMILPTSIAMAGDPDIKVYIDGKYVRVFDSNKLEDGKLWVSAEAMANDFYAIYYELPDSSGFVMKNEYYEITGIYGSTSLSINDYSGARSVTTPALQKDGVISYVPLEALVEAFEADWSWDDGTKTATVTFTPANPVTRYDGSLIADAAPGEIVTYGLARDGWYEIPCDDPTATVTVWWRSQNPENFYLNDNNRYTGNAWIIAPEPAYVVDGSYPEGGYFTGSVGFLYEDTSDLLRVRIDYTNGTSKEFKTTVTTQKGPYGISATSNTIAHYNLIIPNTSNDLLLRTTFENISVYLDYTPTVQTYALTDSANKLGGGKNVDMPTGSHEVWYKEASSSTWLEALELAYDHVQKQFRGSIVNLKAGTTYDVKVVIGTDEFTSSITTWSEDVNIAQTINIADIYTPGEPLSIQGLKGTENGWIRIVGDGSTVIEVSDEFWQAVAIGTSEYVILENLTIKGGWRYGVNIHSSASNIRLVNCDISGWGRQGVHYSDPVKQVDTGNANYRLRTDFRTGWYFAANGAPINNDAGIGISDASFVVIEKCYLHDPQAQTNAWNAYGVKNQVLGWSDRHAAGASGIYMRGGQGIVIRYNDFIGSDEHRWNDIVESYYNGGVAGGVGLDSDIYGNYFAYANDDSAEMEGSGMNVRYYGNKIEGVYYGVSTNSIQIGPVYIFRNLFVNMGDEFDAVAGALKTGISATAANIDVGRGVDYIFNNTIYLPVVGDATRPNSEFYRPVYRNNIIEVASEARTAIKHLYSFPGVSYDYDIVYGKTSEVFLADAATVEEHGYLGQKATFVDTAAGNMALASGSLGIDQGTVIPNFTTEFEGTAPDIGALEYGGDNLMPIRPIGLRAENYQVNVTGNTKATITINVDSSVVSGTAYKLVKNEAFDWFTVTNTSGGTTGTLTPGGTLTLTITGIPSNIGSDYAGIPRAVGKGAFLIELTGGSSSGHSLPVSVYVTNENIPVVDVTSVELDKDTAVLKVGKTLQLTATVYPADATDKQLIWASTDDSVATVSQSGLVTALSAGSVLITATSSNGIVGQCAVVVETLAPGDPVLFNDDPFAAGGGRHNVTYYLIDGAMASAVVTDSLGNEIAEYRDEKQAAGNWVWTSYNKAVMPAGEYTMVITATYGGITEICTAIVGIAADDTMEPITDVSYQTIYADLFTGDETAALDAENGELVIGFETVTGDLSFITPTVSAKLNGIDFDATDIDLQLDPATGVGSVTLTLPSNVQVGDVITYSIGNSETYATKVLAGSYTVSAEDFAGINGYTFIIDLTADSGVASFSLSPAAVKSGDYYFYTAATDSAVITLNLDSATLKTFGLKIGDDTISSADIGNYLKLTGGTDSAPQLTLTFAAAPYALAPIAPAYSISVTTSPVQKQNDTPTPGKVTDTAPSQYHTIRSMAGVGGSITPSGNVQVGEGADQTFVFKANSGYILDYVMIDGTTRLEDISEYTFKSVGAEHTIQAFFKEIGGSSPSSSSGVSLPSTAVRSTIPKTGAPLMALPGVLLLLAGVAILPKKRED